MEASSVHRLIGLATEQKSRGSATNLGNLCLDCASRPQESICSAFLASTRSLSSRAEARMGRTISAQFARESRPLDALPYER